MICPSCKKIIPDDAKFCRYCGEKIELLNEKNSNDKIELARDVENNDIPKEINDFPPPKKDRPFMTFIVLCIIALALAGGLMYLRSGNDTELNSSNLTQYTCAGKSSQLTIKVPFELKDTKPDAVDSNVNNMVYKTGMSSNFRVEVVGIKYNFDISTLTTKDMMNGFMEILDDEKDISNIEKISLTDSVINGNECTKQTFTYYDKKTKDNLENMCVALKMNNEMWVVVTSYKKGDKKASGFAEEIINSIILK